MAIDGFLTRSVRDTAIMLDACEGADLGAPYWAPPLAKGHAAAISRPPRRLRIGDLRHHPDRRRRSTPRLPRRFVPPAACWKSLGHHVEPALPRADVPGMMRAWTDIVAIGTALGIRSALNGRPLTPDLVEGVGRGAVAHAETLHPTRYLEAVGEIHAFGRADGRLLRPRAPTSCCRPPWPNRLPASVASAMTPPITSATAPDRRGSSPIPPSAPSSTPAASPPPACPWAGPPGACPSASTWPPLSVQDETLIALCAEVERAAPWAAKRAADGGMSGRNRL